MKKYPLILSLVLSIFILKTNNVSATSGACSSHGGVNCSAGIGNLGANAICNDGYESSTNYYDTDECIGKLSSCAEPIKSYCTNPSDYIRHCGTPNQYTYEMYDICHKDCENQINKYQSDLNNYQICISKIATSNVNLNQSQQKIADMELQAKQADIILKQALDSSKQQNLNASCGDPLATYNQKTSGCECESGYIYTKNKCTLTQEEFNKLYDQIRNTQNTTGKQVKSTNINKPKENPNGFLDNIVLTTNTTTVVPKLETTKTIVHKSLFKRITDFFRGIFNQ